MKCEAIKLASCRATFINRYQSLPESTNVSILFIITYGKIYNDIHCIIHSNIYCNIYSNFVIQIECRAH